MPLRLVAEDVSVARGGRLLFEGVGFVADAGDLVELRGANGSGKTSLLRAIAGFLRPRAGRIAFEGVEEPPLALHYLGHLNALKGAASVRSHLSHWLGLFGGGIDEDVALERVGLTRQAKLPARVLSQGQGRRLSLARLLIAPRPIWLLDEPAAALDVEGRAMLCRLIDAHRAEGGLVVAAVHDVLGPTPSQTLQIGATT